MISDQVPKLIGDQFDRPSNVHGKTGPKLSYGENSKSLSHQGLEWYRDVTPGQTDGHQDRITIANIIALSRKN